MNTLYYGDNLTILQKHVSDASIDLVYLDPPFNSNRDYNVLFKEQSGGESPAQIKAFGDTWNWAGAADAWHNFAELCPNAKVIELMHGFRNAIGENDVMAYLVMMAPRLYHLHRVLKPTGSLYLHCDPTASAYLRLILDCLFSPKNFRSEITWKRHSAHNDAKRTYAAVTDTIFYCVKSSTAPFHVQRVLHDPVYIEKFFRFEDEKGRRYRCNSLKSPSPRPNLTYAYKGYPPPSTGWTCNRERMEEYDRQGRLEFPKSPTGRISLRYFLDDMQGPPVSNLWDDVPALSGAHAERLGYPTQKPLALLERIILASSNPGDVVMDPFCGCGTAIIAAEKLGRKWIGIDVTPIATSLIQKRLYDSFGAKDQRLVTAADAPERAFQVEGLPTDRQGAQQMFLTDHKKFEMWAVGLVPAIPQEKRGADGGIDGLAYFQDNPKSPSKAVVQVKGGHVGVAQIRDLRGVMARDKAQLGFFICLETPTQIMLNEALSAGFYTPPSTVGRKVPALQIRTVEQLLNHQPFDFPVTRSNVSYAQASAVIKEAGQESLEL